MAQITFTIPNNKIDFFIDCFGAEYDDKVSRGLIDGVLISKSDYAKQEAFNYLANKVKIWNKQNKIELLTDLDITV